MNDAVASASADLFVSMPFLPCADLCGPVDGSIQWRQRVVYSVRFTIGDLSSTSRNGYWPSRSDEIRRVIQEHIDTISAKCSGSCAGC